MFETPTASRRAFVKQTAAGVAGTLAAARLTRAEESRDHVRVGLIGVGIRGYQLHDGLLESKHAQVAAVADVSEHYLDRIRPRLADPQTPLYRDYRRVLDDPSIDAVVIATPDHWHYQMTYDALDAGKDVYVEKPLCYSLNEAIKLRDKARSSARATQVGYQRRTLDHFHQAREIVRSGLLGEITQIQLWSSRNRTAPPWRTFDNYDKVGLPEKSGPEHVDWERFQANRSPRPYDPRRFFHWQCYEEYSTGIFGILMSHPLDAANLVMDLEPPEVCCAVGGIFKYDDGRTVPDTCNALLHYPSRRLTISFIGSSNNAFFDQEAQYRGTHGTLELGVSWLRIYAEDQNELFTRYVPQEKRSNFGDLRKTPILDLPVDYRWSTTPHFDDFFLNVKTRGTCKASIEECFTAMVGVTMAIRSSQSERTVQWDAQNQRIIG